MVSKTLSGITYDFDDLNGSDNRGYADLVTPGSGGSAVPRYIAIMIDGLADATTNLVTTSTTSITIGTGSHVFTMGAEIPYAVGSFVLAASDSAPTTKWMVGTVTARSGTSLTINVPDTNHYAGSGAVTDWNLSITGPIGATGATGDMAAATYDAASIEEQLVGLTSSQVISNKEIKDFSETAYDLDTVSGAVAVNYEDGSIQHAIVDGDITSLTVSNWPASGKGGSMLLYLIQDGTGGHGITLASAYETQGGEAIALSTGPNDRDRITLVTYDGGTTIDTTIQKDFS
jgi:hypothetical protein